MTTASLIQISSACIGIIGSLFFAVGILRQSVSAMAAISGTSWNFNRHMVAAMAAQKADYLFGGGLIVLAFSAQFASFFVSPGTVAIPTAHVAAVPWFALAITVVLFFILRHASKRIAANFEAQIRERIAQHQEEQ
jgi:hypothetical protein